MKTNNIIRQAVETDIMSILEIYNQGIKDRIATLEESPKDYSYMKEWFQRHQGRFKVVVTEQDGKVMGWASLNPYSNRCAYDGVAELSIYISRDHRGKGLGKKLLIEIELLAIVNHFYKIVLSTLTFNQLGQGLYRKMGYREVGVFKNQGKLDGKFVDVMAMEKFLG
ncbi:arsinothricin resistance N-acetyltransferase ArsN1 family A [Bacillus paramycoides]|uniref:arsinothricin resistance N-acetyltransferase ArsN1 family A n=1 Tax=Bacillus paramycoides TaxID=2026194 RepID=UPI003D07AF4F